MSADDGVFGSCGEFHAIHSILHNCQYRDYNHTR